MHTPTEPVSAPRIDVAPMANEMSCAAPGAAKGDDDLMSAPCPPRDMAAGRWQGQISAARLNWRQLSVDDLVKVDGQPSRLARLLRDRCAFSEALADRQARDFFAKHMA